MSVPSAPDPAGSTAVGSTEIETPTFVGATCVDVAFAFAVCSGRGALSDDLRLPARRAAAVLGLVRALVDAIRVRRARGRRRGVGLGDGTDVARALVPDDDVQVQWVDLSGGGVRIRLLRRRCALRDLLRLASPGAAADLTLLGSLLDLIGIAGGRDRQWRNSSG